MFAVFHSKRTKFKCVRVMRFSGVEEFDPFSGLSEYVSVVSQLKGNSLSRVLL